MATRTASRAAIQGARNDAFSEALEGIRRSAARAVATCEALMKSSKDPSIKLAAARAVLAAALRTNEQISIEERLRAVESQVKGGGER